MIYLLDLAHLAPGAPCSPVRREELRTLHNPALIRQKQGAEALLWHAFSLAYPDETCPFDYARTEKGKPFFPAYPNFYFSLSHTPDFALCVVCSVPCGADIERSGRISKRLIAQRFHPVQQQYLAGLPDVEQSYAATQMWCMYEAYAKACGKGISGVSQDFYVLPNGQTNVSSAWFYTFTPASDYCAAVCTLTPVKTCEFKIIHV